MAISYVKFKRTFGDLGITEWVKFNWLSNSGFARKIYNKVVEAGYNPLAYVNNELYNHIEGEKFLVLVSSVDLGTLNWVYESSLQVFRNKTPFALMKEWGQVLCSKYTTNNNLYATNLTDKTITTRNYYFATNICIKDTSYTNAVAFKAAMSGVILYYELATPVLIDL